MFCDQDVVDPHFRTVKTNKIQSKTEYSRFVLKELCEHISTPYVLLVQWDGYVLDPRAWRPEFLHYDLIGAKWHWYKDGMTVGNGGFSLRSRRLLEAIRSSQFPFIPDSPEDDQICRVYQPELISDFGIRFAPEHIADIFSYECSTPEVSTFGFHGLYNMWRHVEDSEMISLSHQFTTNVLRSEQFSHLITKYLAMRKFPVFEQLVFKALQTCSIDDLLAQAKKIIVDQKFFDLFSRTCSKIELGLE